ncbi:MAG: glycosyltransferase family 4 protein [Candidatus Omnitrophica bacterium]|nr:glycosyltransferase family 4 protein [Candidatus Omnitrophota bacterium]
MRKINLFFIITKLELGGAQKHLLSLILFLEKSKYNIFLFTAKEGLLVNDALSLGGITLIKSEFLERPVNFINDLLAFGEICSFIKKNNIDIVHTHGSKAGILGRFAAKCTGVKVLLHTVHGWSFNDYQNFFLRRLFIWLERLCARFSDRIIVVCEYDKRKGLAKRIGTCSKYCIIHYGIDYREFSRKDINLRRELGLDNHDLVVGMVACFKPQKSPLDFIEAARRVTKILPQARFLLIGDGVLRKDIEAQIIKSGLAKNVMLTGWRRDISGILSSLDVFVLTSLWEGVPISVLEAMAASKPVVVTNTGGITEVITDGVNGYLVSAKNAILLSERIIALLVDVKLRERMGENARRSLDNRFSLENMVRNTSALYEAILNGKGAGKNAQ